MRKTKEIRMEWFAVMAAVTIFLVLMMGLMMDRFSIVSHADTKGTVTANAAVIRKETDVNSEALGSVAKGKVIDIRSEVKDSAGVVWYEVYASGQVTGYIRGDLVEVSGSVPAGETPSSTPSEPPVMNPTVEVTALEPLSATITANDTRVRADASTDGAIITTVASGMAVTVNGQATGTDGKTWYQVGFNSDGTEVAGFVRDDYLTLSGEAVPLGEGTPSGDGGGAEGGEPQDPAAPTKDYDTQLQNGEWYLLDYGAGEQYKVEQLLTATKSNYEAYKESLGTIKIQKIVIIVMVVLLVLAILAATLLFFKIRDVMDEAYFSAVEKETVRARSAGKGQAGRTQGASSRRVMQTIGGDESGPAASGKTVRPAAQKSQSSQGRPGAVQGQPKPSGGMKSPAGQPRAAAAGQGRPSGAVQGQGRSAGAPGTVQTGTAGAGQGQPRPAGNGGMSQARPTGSGQPRPAGAAAPGGAVKPASNAQPRTAPSGKMSGSVSSARPAGQPRPGAQQASGRPAGQNSRPAQLSKPGHQDPGWKSKNFMTDDDDEFEFEFLNWDEDDN